MPSPSHSSWSAHLTNSWRAVQKMQLLFSSTVTSSLLGPNIFLSTLFSNTLIIYFSLTVKPNFHTHTKQRPTQSSVRLNPLNLIILLAYYAWPETSSVKVTQEKREKCTAQPVRAARRSIEGNGRREAVTSRRYGNCLTASKQGACTAHVTSIICFLCFMQHA